MRIVHFAQFGPRSCGLYETTKDLILAERRLGVDARLVDIDADGKSRAGLKDGDILTDPPDIAYDADVLIRHTAIPTKYQNIGVPIVMCLHGRPESSYRIAAGSDNNIPLALANKARDARYKAFVTFWPEHAAAWRAIVGDSLHVITAPVDREYYAGGRDKQLSGSHRLLIADIWRDDVIPLNSLIGAAQYVRRYDPTARIHCVGLPSQGKALAALQPFLNGLSDVIGSAAGQVKDIRDWYASCDVTITPHTIATRVIRESLAASCPVVAGEGCRYTSYCANHADPNAVAEAINECLSDIGAESIAYLTGREFDSIKAGGEMIDICRSVMRQPQAQKKVFLDVGAHLGQSVRRFYRERPDADDFEIYCFEPDPQTHERLFANVGAMPNVHCICAALGSSNGVRSLRRGQVNSGDGSTMLAGKLTGGLDGETPIRCDDIGDWLDRLTVGNNTYCVVKMNVEGAEYELLPHLARTGNMAAIDELYVQLHSLKFDLAHRIEMDKTELKWIDDMKRFETKVFATTKGMASFGNSYEP